MAALCAGLAFGQSPAGESKQNTQFDPAVSAAVQQHLRELDSREFFRRQQAQEELRKLVERKELGPALSAEFSRVLVSQDASLEVRTQLAELLAGLPPAARLPPDEKTGRDEIGRSIGQMNDDSYAVRLAASRRLAWFLTSPKLICPVMLETRARLADATLSGESRRQLESLLDSARNAWLHSEQSNWSLPPVSTEQMGRWIDAALDSNEQAVAAAAVAERELIDLLVRDDTRPALEKLLAERISTLGEDLSSKRLAQIAQWSKPAMVAEIWTSHRQITEQHLLVGIPQYPEGAPRATFFDRVDDRVAHCVSGNTLTPGDYPVNVAIPHPQGQDHVFHLISLSTAQKRQAYFYDARRPDEQRLAELSRRTMNTVLAEKRPLAVLDILMLEQLDARAVGEFVGPYFQAVDDRDLSNSGLLLTGRSSMHGAICYVLARTGGAETAPVIEQAWRGGRISRPTAEAPYNMAPIAVLAIANRDPWKDVDDWLLKLVERDDLLVAGETPASELGATAAGLLLARHSLLPRMEHRPTGAGPDPAETFGLERLADSFMDRLGFTPFRFTTPEKRQEFLQFWRRHKALEEARQGSS